MADIDAEDVLHEVAFNVFKKIDFETSIENIAAYLFRSVKNKITDITRKSKKTVSMSLFENTNGSNTLLETTKNEEESIEKEIEKKELFQQLNKALQELPENYRNIIFATEYDGRTIQELANEWGIPLGTLLSRRHRALTRLQKILENDTIK